MYPVWRRSERAAPSFAAQAWHTPCHCGYARSSPTLPESLLSSKTLRVLDTAQLLKRSKVRFILLLDFALLIRSLRGEPTWAMKVQVGVEHLLAAYLDLLYLPLRDMRAPHLLANDTPILSFYG